MSQTTRARIAAFEEEGRRNAVFWDEVDPATTGTVRFCVKNWMHTNQLVAFLIDGKCLMTATLPGLSAANNLHADCFNVFVSLAPGKHIALVKRRDFPDVPFEFVANPQDTMAVVVADMWQNRTNAVIVYSYHSNELELVSMWVTGVTTSRQSTNDAAGAGEQAPGSTHTTHGNQTPPDPE